MISNLKLLPFNLVTPTGIEPMIKKMLFLNFYKSSYLLIY
nr:MAG TPA: hypothetical protein [Caudoviricetes sp.]